MLPRQRLTQAPGWMLSTLQKKQWRSVRRRLEGHTHTLSLKDGGPGRAGYRLHEEPSNCSVPPTLYHLLCPALFSYKASACPFGTINSFSIAVMRPWSFFPFPLRIATKPRDFEVGFLSSSVLAILFSVLSPCPSGPPVPRACQKTESDTQVPCPAFNIEFLFLVGLEAPTALGVNVRKIPRM